ncbi:MAG: hypothetical protein GY814_19155 [Gammaproteobacteria bacterium]|nr:hypothetical protein [Gammaproteobacteria bacterium]
MSGSPGSIDLHALICPVIQSVVTAYELSKSLFMHEAWVESMWVRPVREALDSWRALNRFC